MQQQRFPKQNRKTIRNSIQINGCQISSETDSNEILVGGLAASWGRIYRQTPLLLRKGEKKPWERFIIKKKLMQHSALRLKIHTDSAPKLMLRQPLCA